MIEEVLPSLRRFTFLALLSAVLLIGGMLLVRWLTAPGHTPAKSSSPHRTSLNPLGGMAV